MIKFWEQNLKSNENKTIDNTFPPLLHHTTTPTDTCTDTYLDLILKEVIYTLERNKELQFSGKRDSAIRMLNSIFRPYGTERTQKEFHKIWLFTRCLTDLLVNKPEIIGYMLGEICKNKIIENKESDKLSSILIELPFNLSWSIRPYVELFDPESTQVSFFIKPCYELSEKSIYDLENVITKFVLNRKEKEERTLNDLHPIYIEGIKEFLEIYTYPLQNVLAEMTIEYWIYRLPELIDEKTSIFKITPGISEFTNEALLIHKDFYMNINEEFENFEYKNVNEKNNIIPFIYYWLSVKIIHSLIYIIDDIYDILFNDDRFTNWYKFAKFFIYPVHEILDDFSKKLIIDDNNNKFKLYKYFSNCNNKRLIESIWDYMELCYNLVYYELDCKYMFIPKRYEDEEWIDMKNKFLENKNILEKWIDYFKELQ